MEEISRESKTDADLSPEFLELRERTDALIARAELLMETSMWGNPASSKRRDITDSNVLKFVTR